MKTINLIIILICYCNLAISQIYIDGKVIDAETNQPVPYVNIGVKNSSIGTVSDNNGVFQLNLNSGEDIITFSSIGYETFNIRGDKLLNQDSIKLIPKKYQMQEIEIVAHKFEGEDEIFGVKNKTRGLSIGFGSRNLGTEIGALISIKEPVYIKNANFVINHAKGDSLLFRVNIYDYQNGTVKENILKENVLISTKQRRGVITVDLTLLDLILTNDVLLTLEWIKDDNGKGNSDITFDTKKAKRLKGVYVKKSSIGEFKEMPYINSKLKPCFYFIGKKIN